MNELVTEQSAPLPNDNPAVWDLVIADMQARDGEGRRKYGTPLQPFNGRDALIDAYQEALDLVVYLRTAIYEREQRAAAPVPQEIIHVTGTQLAMFFTRVTPEDEDLEHALWRRKVDLELFRIGGPISGDSVILERVS